jgi:hypothetical protein
MISVNVGNIGFNILCLKQPYSIIHNIYETLEDVGLTDQIHELQNLHNLNSRHFRDKDIPSTTFPMSSKVRRTIKDCDTSYEL